MVVLAVKVNVLVLIFVRPPLPEVVPDKEILPFPPILASVFNVMGLMQLIAVVVLLYKAPTPLYPVPFKVIGSASDKVNPLRSKVPPEFTVVVPVISPNTVVAAAHFNMPAFMMILPELVILVAGTSVCV